MKILWKMSKSIPLCVCQSALRHTTRRRRLLSEMMAFLWWIPLLGRHHSHADHFQCLSRRLVGDGWPLTFGWDHPVQTGDDSRQREADTICACQALKCITLKPQHRALSWVLIWCVWLLLFWHVGILWDCLESLHAWIPSCCSLEKQVGNSKPYLTLKWSIQHQDFYLFFHPCLPLRFYFPLNILFYQNYSTKAEHHSRSLICFVNHSLC